MDKQILVAHGSEYGATADITQKIVQVLTDNKFTVDVLAAKQVKDIAAYQAVAALYISANG
jgi:menaquinone-dependent protoporphyrinogen IX oxidase